MACATAGKGSQYPIAAHVGRECSGPRCKRRKAAAVRERMGPPQCTLQGCGSTPYVSKVCAFLRKFSSAVAGVCPLEEKRGVGQSSHGIRRSQPRLRRAAGQPGRRARAQPGCLRKPQLHKGVPGARHRQTGTLPSRAQGSSPVALQQLCGGRMRWLVLCRCQLFAPNLILLMAFVFHY